MKNRQDILRIIRTVLCDEKENKLKNPDLEEILRIAKEQHIYALILHGLEMMGYSLPPENVETIAEYLGKNFAISTNQLLEAERICATFEAQEIDHLQLKGVTIKRFYPSPELRYMGDVDILIRTEQFKKVYPIMKSLGFAFQRESDHEYIWKKKNGVCVELHKCLMPEEDDDFNGYFGSGWDRAKPVPGMNFRYAFSPEDELVYIFTHFAKHYRSSGVGIRQMMDLFLYLRAKPEMDLALVRKQLRELKLDTFFDNVCLVLDVWFKEGKPTPITDHITQTVFSNGVFGTFEGRQASAIVRSSSKHGSLRRARRNRRKTLIFPPYRTMRVKYPVLKRAPVLLPAFWVCRWFSVFTIDSERRKGYFSMLKPGRAEQIQASLHYVGLEGTTEDQPQN